MLLNKTDLLPYLDFDVQQCLDYARQVNPHIKIIQLSAKTADSMKEWYDWLKAQSAKAQSTKASEQAFV